MDIFEYASRNKLRFEFKGLLTVEDLWDLNTASLDKIYKNLKSEEKANEGESLLEVKKEDLYLKAKIEIIKIIVADTINEAEKKVKALKEKQTRVKIMKLIQEKEDESLKGLSLEELKKLL